MTNNLLKTLEQFLEASPYYEDFHFRPDLGVDVVGYVGDKCQFCNEERWSKDDQGNYTRELVPHSLDCLWLTLKQAYEEQTAFISHDDARIDKDVECKKPLMMKIAYGWKCLECGEEIIRDFKIYEEMAPCYVKGDSDDLCKVCQASVDKGMEQARNGYIVGGPSFAEYVEPECTHELADFCECDLGKVK